LRIPTMPITHSDLMAITIPSDADRCRSEAALPIFRRQRKSCRHSAGQGEHDALPDLFCRSDGSHVTSARGLNVGAQEFATFVE
jgi:hypothetical protein